MVINIIHCSSLLIIDLDNAFLAAISGRHLNGCTLSGSIVYYVNSLPIDRS